MTLTGMTFTGMTFTCMNFPATTRGWMLLVVFIFCTGSGALAQDFSGQSLGDLARKTRSERAASSHVPAKQVATDDLDGPDGGGVWRMRLCYLTYCDELSITLPKNPKWRRPAQEPRPVLIPISGHEEDASRAIRIYAAQSSELRYNAEGFKRTFLQSWFAKPEYFGQSAVLVREEHVPIDWATGIITHFTITTDLLRYRGLSVTMVSAYGSFGFACVFREEDSSVGTSTCDAIVKSAQFQQLQPSTIRRTYPEDDPPGDPAINSQRNDDPE